MTFLPGQIGVIYNLCHFWKYINSFTFYTISENNTIGIPLQHTFFFIFFSQSCLSFSCVPAHFFPFMYLLHLSFRNFLLLYFTFFSLFRRIALDDLSKILIFRRFIHATSNEDYFANPRKMAGTFTKSRANKL